VLKNKLSGGSVARKLVTGLFKRSPLAALGIAALLLFAVCGTCDSDDDEDDDDDDPVENPCEGAVDCEPIN
jgi:hypothetical protein